MLNKIEKVLKHYKLKYRIPDDGEGNIQLNCPFCNEDRECLGIGIENLKWNCFICGIKGLTLKSFNNELKKWAKGNYKQRKSDKKLEKEEKVVKIDQRIPKAAFKNHKDKKRKVAEYLRKGRGFTNDTIKHFMLGSRKFSGHEYIVVPYYEDGQCVNIKYRTAEPKPKGAKAIKEWKKYKWRREKGGKSSLFNDVILKEEMDYVFITEAEFDCISLYNAGEKNVVSVTVGAKGFKQDWYERLRGVDKIYLLFDNDLDGQTGAKKIAKRLGLKRCYNIILPDDVKDLNEFFWDDKRSEPHYKLEDFQELVKSAKQFEVSQVQSLRQVLRRVYANVVLKDEEQNIGYMSPWENVNKIIGGVKPGHLVVIAAKPKTGKTTMILNWMVDLAKSGYPFLFICCEMKDEELAIKVIAINRKDYTDRENITEHQILETSVSLPVDDMHFSYPSRDQLEIDTISKKIEEAVQRYGIKAVVFDNLHFLVRGDNVSNRIGEVTRGFKMLAEELDIAFFLITHPRKTNHNRPLSVDDLKDSSSIFQDLDTLILMHRAFIDDDAISEDGENEKSMSDLCEMSVTSRWNEGGKCFLWFNGKRSLFKSHGPSYDKEMKKLSDKITEKRRRREKSQRNKR